MFVLYLLIRIREVLARDLGSGDWVEVLEASINIFASTSKNRPWRHEFKKDVYIREFGKSGNVVLLTYYVFPFFFF